MFSSSFDGVSDTTIISKEEIDIAWDDLFTYTVIYTIEDSLVVPSELDCDGNVNNK
jgi:hypothetical protein